MAPGPREASARAILSAFGIAAAGGILLTDPPAWAAALAASGAVAAAWILGPAGRGRSFTAAFLVSITAGTVLAAGAGALVFGLPLSIWGLPLSLWGLLLGVFLISLLLTTVGFALDFEPPDPRGLERLRRGR